MSIEEFAEKYEISLSKLRKKMKSLGILRQDNKPRKEAAILISAAEEYNTNLLLYVLINEVHITSLPANAMVFFNQEGNYKEIRKALRKQIGARRESKTQWVRVLPPKEWV